MKGRLALTVVVALAISLLPGCRDFITEEYQEARAERTEAQAKVAVLEAELEAVHKTITDIQKELEVNRAEMAELKAELEKSQTKVSELEAELKTYQTKVSQLESELEKWQTGIYTMEDIIPSEQLTPLQEEDFRYRGFEYRIASVHVVMLSATWNNDKLTVSWELENKSTRKIYLNLLAVKAHDQMGLKGERKVIDEENGVSDEENGVTEEAVAIYPDLQDDIKTPWPGETVQFTTEWEFGPLSEVITIDFILVPSEGMVPQYLANEVIPSFTVTH